MKEIQAALPRLSAEELGLVEAALLEQFRKRKVGILYDDAYGVWTEEDQASAAAQAFVLMDREEFHPLNFCEGLALLTNPKWPKLKSS